MILSAVLLTFCKSYNMIFFRNISLTVCFVCSNNRSLFYQVRFEFHKRKFYRDWSILTPAAILSFMERTFLVRLSRAMDRHVRDMQKMS